MPNSEKQPTLKSYFTDQGDEIGVKIVRQEVSRHKLRILFNFACEKNKNGEPTRIHTIYPGGGTNAMIEGEFASTKKMNPDRLQETREIAVHKFSCAETLILLKKVRKSPFIEFIENEMEVV